MQCIRKYVVVSQICCSESQCVTARCNMLQYIAAFTHMQYISRSVLQCVTVCCSVLQCVAVCCSKLQCVAVCSSVLQRDAVCCSAFTRYDGTHIQFVAVCCSDL